MVATFDGVLTGVVKIVGVSDDHDRVATCETELQRVFGTQISAARSQPYYLDVTHPTATKATVVERLARYLKIPAEAIATVGDQPSVVLMFERSGLSVSNRVAPPLSPLPSPGLWILRLRRRLRPRVRRRWNRAR